MNNQIFTIIAGLVMSMILLFGNKKLVNAFKKKTKSPETAPDEKTIKLYERMFFLLGLFGLVIVLSSVYTIFTSQ